MRVLLLVALLVSGYNFGTIWAHEIDIFRSWRLVGEHFQTIQKVHWRKLPYWVLGSVTIGFIMSVVLLWLHPSGSAPWAWSSFATQAASGALTAATWGRWQASLAHDPRGAESPYLGRILATHWIRTALYSANAIIVVLWAIAVVGS